jgi:hypothetical protein
MTRFTKLAFDPGRHVWALGRDDGEVSIGIEEFVNDGVMTFDEPIKVRRAAVEFPVLTVAGLMVRRLVMRRWADGELTFRGAFDADGHRWFVVDETQAAADS